QLERHRETLPQHRRDRQPVEIRDAEVALHDAAEPQGVLHRQRAVEPHEGPRPAELLGARVTPEERDRGVAGDEVDHQPDPDRRHQEHGQELEEPEEDVACHQARRSAATARPAPPRSTSVWSVSANALSESTESVITIPGKSPYHGAWWRKDRPVFSMEPHEGVGGWVPSPRKESAASRSMATAPVTATWTTIGVRAFSRIVRNMRYAGPTPRARVATTNSRSLSES